MQTTRRALAVGPMHTHARARAHAHTDVNKQMGTTQSPKANLLVSWPVNTRARTHARTYAPETLVVQSDSAVFGLQRCIILKRAGQLRRRASDRALGHRFGRKDLRLRVPHGTEFPISPVAKCSVGHGESTPLKRSVPGRNRPPQKCICVHAGAPCRGGQHRGRVCTLLKAIGDNSFDQL